MCGYHRFQQAEFSESVLAELKRLFETRSELLHQKVTLHAYTTLLSRLQVESYLYHLLKGEKLVTAVGGWPSMHSSPKFMLCLYVCSIRLLRQPDAALFSAALERGHQRPVQLHTQSSG